MEIDRSVLTPETERLIREIGIPPCPQVLIDFMKEVHSDDTDLHRVSHLISRDVGLAATVLQTANSAFYGLRHKAPSIHEALFAIGLRNAANLIAGLMLKRAFATMDPVAMNEFWESTSRVGLTAAYLGRELGVAELSQAHTYALFRDCGSPLLMQKFPAHRALVQAAGADCTQHVTQLEQAHYGVDHASIGANLAMKWYLPDDIWQAIEMHHAPRNGTGQANAKPGKTEKLVALGSLADCLYRTYKGVDTSGNWQHEEELALAMLEVRREDIEPLQQDISRILSGP